MHPLPSDIQILHFFSSVSKRDEVFMAILQMQKLSEIKWL